MVPAASTGAARHRGLRQGGSKMLVGKTGFESHPCSVRTVAELHSAWRVYLAAGSHCDPLQEPLNLNTVASDCHCLEFETNVNVNFSQHLSQLLPGSASAFDKLDGVSNG